MQNTQTEGQTIMNQKEQLKNQIEEERRKLDCMIADGGKVRDVYRQSLFVDQLIERYMDCNS